MAGLVATKLGPPGRRSRLLHRPRLQALLEASGEVRLVLVSAPAGFGKTTLVATWLATSDASWGWLSIEAADNDGARFARYLTAAAGAQRGRSVAAGVERRRWPG